MSVSRRVPATTMQCWGAFVRASVRSCVIKVHRKRGVGDQSSLLAECPGSLVGGVRRCEELPKLDRCFSSSELFFGFHLKKLFSFPVRLLPGLGMVGDVVSEVAFECTGSSIVSFC